MIYLDTHAVIWLYAGRVEEFPAAVLAEIELRVCRIPFHDVVHAAYEESWTRDPFDRLIVAQAKAGEGKLISKDRRIRAAYAGAIW